MEYSFKKHRIIGGIGADERYWESLEEGSFRLPRCLECKRWMWPANWRCSACGGWDLEWMNVDPVGTVFSWTRTHQAFERVKERAGQLPYVIVVAEIPEAGHARVLGVLKGHDTGLRIGAPVVGTIDAPSPEAKGYPAIRWSIQR